MFSYFHALLFIQFGPPDQFLADFEVYGVYYLVCDVQCFFSFSEALWFVVQCCWSFGGPPPLLPQSPQLADARVLIVLELWRAA